MKKTFIIIAALLLAAIPLKAQQEDTYNESVVVKGSYRPVIEQREKLNFPAVISDSLGRMEHDFQYGITPVRLRALYEPSRIKAARIIGEPATRLYNNYLRLGFGNYWTPLADLYWSSTRDKKKTYGVSLNHLSSWDRLPDYGPNHFGNTAVTLFGKYIFAEKLQLSTDLNYEHDHNLYYGFTDSTLQAVLGRVRDSVKLDEYRAGYNIVTWNLGFKNMELDVNKFGYAANLRLSDLWATWEQNELNLNLSGDVHYGFPLLREYKGVAYLHAEWDGYTHSVSPDGRMPLGYTPTPTTDTVRGYRNLVKVNPYVDFFFSGLQIHSGFTVGWDGFSNDTNVVFRCFPDLVVSKKFFNDNIAVSLAVTGGMEAVNWNTLRQVNPYIVPDADQRATKHYDFLLNTRWTLSRKLEANAEVGYSLLQDDLTFTLDPHYSLHNVYRPLYIDDNRFTAGGTIAFVNDEMLTLRAGGHYYTYNQRPLYRPDWDALVSAKVNYHDKWLFYLEGSLLGQMDADNDETLPMRYGIAAEVEYRYNRALSFFLRMDNLAFQRYYYWANYPSQRGLFLVGLTYTLPTK
ncbi:MAG: hypothetical protein IK010_03690 [Bacteroidales bacterium]|nr:hypothetical protein [Bacteroidales bacterium]